MHAFRKYARKLAILMIAIPFLNGCIVYFEHPLSAVGEQNPDQRLFGTWYWNDKNDNGYIHIGKSKESGQLLLMMVEFTADKHVKLTRFTGHTAAIGPNTYLNLKWVSSKKGRTDAFMIVKYEFRSGKLGITLMDSEVVEKAVANGKLAGQIIPVGKFTSDVVVGADQKAVAAFILQNDTVLFEDTKFLSRNGS